MVAVAVAETVVVVVVVVVAAAAVAVVLLVLRTKILLKCHLIRDLRQIESHCVYTTNIFYSNGMKRVKFRLINSLGFGEDLSA